MKLKSVIFSAVFFLFLGVFPLLAQTDVEGCKDHPLFSRMANFYLDTCEVNDFDSYEFYLDEEKTVVVEGHTDNTGTPQGNKTLSLKRAEAVVTALAQAGIAAGRLQAIGWGQEKPVADNRSEEGRAENRRVEVVKK